MRPRLLRDTSSEIVIFVPLPGGVVFGYRPVLDGRAGLGYFLPALRAGWAGLGFFVPAFRAGRAGLTPFPTHTSFWKKYLSQSKIPGLPHFDLLSMFPLHHHTS